MYGMCGRWLLRHPCPPYSDSYEAKYNGCLCVRVALGLTLSRPPELCGWQAAAAAVPATMAARPGPAYSHDRLPEVGSSVVFKDAAVAAAYTAKHHPWVAMRVTAASRSYSGGVSVCGVGDGVEIASGIDPSHLAEAQDRAWLPLHYAMVMGCEASVVKALLEAHPEVIQSPPPYTLFRHPLGAPYRAAASCC